MSSSGLQPSGGACSVADSARAEARAWPLADLRLASRAYPVTAAFAELDMR